MKVQVQVTIDVVERQTRIAELLKLRMNFCSYLLAQLPSKKIAKPGATRTVSKLAMAINKSGNLLRRQGRVAVEKRQMQADAESGIRLGECNCFFEGGFIDHKAGGG